MRSSIAGFLMVLLASGVMTVQAQDRPIRKKDVPKAVLQAFQKSYPNATIRGTAKEREHGVTYYEIESIDGMMHRDLLYKKNGTVAEIEEGIEPGSLPAGVKAALSKAYPDYKVTKAERTTHGSVTDIEVLIRTGKNRREIVFDSKGKIRKDEMVKAKKQKKEDKEEHEGDDDDL